MSITKNAKIQVKSGTKNTLPTNLLLDEFIITSDTKEIYKGNASGAAEAVVPDVHSLTALATVLDTDVLLINKVGESSKKVTVAQIANHSVDGGVIAYSLQGGANWFKEDFRPIRLPMAKAFDSSGVEVLPPYGLSLHLSPSYDADDNQVYRFRYEGGIIGLAVGVGEPLIPFQNTFQSYDGMMENKTNAFPTTTEIDTAIKQGGTINRCTVKTNVGLTLPTYLQQHALVLLVLNTAGTTININLPVSDTGKDIVTNTGNNAIVAISAGALREIHWSPFNEITSGRNCYSILVTDELFVLT